MKTIAIIPARMNSSRFPGKPLKKICGLEMIGHCYKRVLLSHKINEVYVATCDKEIFDFVKSINGNVVMTSKKHTRATDRVAEALLKIENRKKKKYDIIIMVQGDEPLVTPKMIDNSISAFKNKSVNVVNLMSQIINLNEVNDRNEIKVVFDKNYDAIYFSREPIPSTSHSKIKNKFFKQVCIIPFRRKYLMKFNSMKETNLEKSESVDMMRFIENKCQVKMILTKDICKSVDTLSDLNQVNIIMKKDRLFGKKYL